jgi:hypothetical protein
MRGKYESRLRRIESRIGHRVCAFNHEESSAMNGIFQKYLGRDPTPDDIRAKNGPVYDITDDELGVITNCVRAARMRG